MAKKLPWFPLYVYDFAQHERVIPMTYEQEGLYLALLRHEWIHGSIPADDAELRGILKPHNPDALAQVKRCFEATRNDQSRLTNPRIEEVRREQSDLSRRFSEAGRKGGVSSGLTRRRVAEARLKGGSSHLEATPKQQSRAEQSRTEQEEQQQLPVADAPTHESEFAPCWMAYPKRAGSNSRADALKAFTRRRKEGVTASDMLSGTQRYAGFISDTGKVGTEFVMQAARFYGPSKHYAESWELPAEGQKLTAKQREEQASLEWVEQREREAQHGE